MRRGKSKHASLFLIAASVCFGFDLLHYGHHVVHDSTLLYLPGVPWRLAWKGTIFLGTVALLIFSWRIFLLVVGFALLLDQEIPPCFAARGNADCEQARELMEESGISRDAKEDFLGRLKIAPPRSSFPPEMDKVTWWGTFKPFEFWESPQFEAVWINPAGETAGRTRFQAGRCRLAKTTLRVDRLPPGRLEPGMWRVVVSCGDVMIDNHPFAVIGSPTSAQDAGKGKDTGIMIWADGVTSG